jgi:hypothetical protein
VEARLPGGPMGGRSDHGLTHPSLTKKVMRVGRGFRNFANYRPRLRLHCSTRWQTHRTARLRHRSPRLVA